MQKRKVFKNNKENIFLLIANYYSMKIFSPQNLFFYASSFEKKASQSIIKRAFTEAPPVLFQNLFEIYKKAYLDFTDNLMKYATSLNSFKRPESFTDFREQEKKRISDTKRGKFIAKNPSTSILRWVKYIRQPENNKKEQEIAIGSIKEQLKSYLDTISESSGKTTFLVKPAWQGILPESICYLVKFNKSNLLTSIDIYNFFGNRIFFYNSFATDKQQLKYEIDHLDLHLINYYNETLNLLKYLKSDEISDLDAVEIGNNWSNWNSRSEKTLKSFQDSYVTDSSNLYPLEDDLLALKLQANQNNVNFKSRYQITPKDFEGWRWEHLIPDLFWKKYNFLNPSDRMDFAFNANPKAELKSIELIMCVGPCLLYKQFNTIHFGFYQPASHTIAVGFSKFSPSDFKSIDSFNKKKNNDLKEMQDILHHELIHYCQELLTSSKTPRFGMSPKKVKEDKEKHRLGNQEEHTFRGIEFYSRLSDSLRNFYQKVKDMPPGDIPGFIRIFTGMNVISDDTDRLFKDTLMSIKTPKHRKLYELMIKKFLSEIGKKGYQI